MNKDKGSWWFVGFAWAFIATLAWAGAARGDETATLNGLARLPKPLLGWSPTFFDNKEEEDAFTQVTGSCAVSLRWSSNDEIGNCFLSIQKDDRNLLAVTYSPMVQDYNAVKSKYKKDPEKMQLELQRVSLDLAGLWAIEFGFIEAKLKLYDMFFRAMNMDNDRLVLMLDHEGAIMNDLTRPVITFKLDQIYTLAKSYGFQVFHYNILSIRADHRVGSGWSEWFMAPPESLTDYASVSWYHPTELLHMREKMRRTLANTDLDVIPFVPLGWRWSRGYNASNGKITRVADQDYSVDFTSLMSDDMHKTWKVNVPEVYFDNRRVPFLYMWPPAGRHESFFPHFYAYHDGALKAGKRSANR